MNAVYDGICVFFIYGFVIQEVEENMYDLMNKLNLYKSQKRPEKSTVQTPKEHVLAAEIVESIYCILCASMLTTTLGTAVVSVVLRN